VGNLCTRRASSGAAVLVAAWAVPERPPAAPPSASSPASLAPLLPMPPLPTLPLAGEGAAGVAVGAASAILPASAAARLAADEAAADEAARCGEAPPSSIEEEPTPYLPARGATAAARKLVGHWVVRRVG
jgi:hypothetical protein